MQQANGYLRNRFGLDQPEGTVRKLDLSDGIRHEPKSWMRCRLEAEFKGYGVRFGTTMWDRSSGR
jgi:hypothetical protein